MSYMLSGYYGFAAQLLKSSEVEYDGLSLEEVVRGGAVDPSPAWLDCWR